MRNTAPVSRIAAFAALSVLSLALALPVLADAPSIGVVVEGISVPGISLGSTRAQVEGAYGDPVRCQDVVEVGDRATCAFSVDGGGQVDIHYRGADGGRAAGAADDVVATVRWNEAVDGWTTTAGVNTTLADRNPQAVLAAYPNAAVTYYYGSDYPLRLTDHEQGIQVEWIWIHYRAEAHVSMLIREPQPAPPPAPPVELLTHVSDIDLTASKEKGKRKVIALVHVRNEVGLAAAGAAVYGTWILPSGISQDAAMPVTTSSSGNAYFAVTSRDRGTYTFIVQDVVLDGYGFDRELSVLRESVTAK